MEPALHTKCVICQEENILYGSWCDTCWKGYCSKCYDTLRSRISEETVKMRKQCDYCTNEFDKKCMSCQKMSRDWVCECNELCKCYFNAAQKIKKEHNIANFVLGEICTGEIQLFCTKHHPRSFILL